ncbi:MAG TPA: hypothetical protein VNW92_06940 [Polyangiaceae bacterium]|jgi:hypothetical protein|nr:hypothetical protein [Polyangiaceae bacterium]
MKRLKKFSVQCAFGAAFVLANLVPTPAFAQQRDPAAAQALFDQARALTRQGRYTEACPKLLESNRLDPGIGTQFHLAECYEQSGQIATAWATFLDVASQARAASQFDREKAATKRATQLEPRLPKLTITVPEPSQLSGLEIRRDGIVVGQTQWGSPVPVDPGPHELSISAPGRRPLNQTLKAEEGKPLAFDVPELETTGESAEPPAAEPAPAPEAQPVTHKHHHHPVPAPTPEPPPTPSSGVDAWPLVLAGAGVVGLAVGTGFALKASSDNTKSKEDCDTPNTNVCGATGVSLRNDAIAAGNVATVGLVGGAALLAVGGLVWDMEYQAHKKSATAGLQVRASAALAPGNAALYFSGGF